MRLFSIRRAKNLDSELRKTFERYGQVGMQIALGDMNHFIHQGKTIKADSVLDSERGALARIPRRRNLD
jgi:hypothetical protein